LTIAVTSPFPSERARGLAAAVVVILVGGAGGSGCFKPSVVDGGFLCNTSFLPDCPDGYKCDGTVNVCRRIGADAAVDQAIEVKADGPAIEHAADTHDAVIVADAACFAPVTNCAADTSKGCDPVCQKGCTGCHQKCSVITTGTVPGTPTCNEPSPTLPRTEGQSCSPVSEGESAQTDDCEPGLVCVEESCGTLCVRFCRADKDCPNSTCTRMLPGGLMGCDVPPSACNPVTALDGGATNCAAAAQGCYLSPTATDQTFCDCPAHAQPPGTACTDSRDCVRGLTCVDATGGNNFLCHITCTLVGPTSGCQGTETCHALGNNVKFGYCN
jgi:hypothetical protein